MTDSRKSSRLACPASLERLARLDPEPSEIKPYIDERRYLKREFDPELPLLTKFYSFPKYRDMVGDDWMHWHDYHEMILPVEGNGCFSVGAWEVEFSPGDLLIVDTLRLHGISKLSGPHRSLVIFFPPDFVTGNGSLLGDAVFLDPLRARPSDVPPILKADHPVAPRVHEALLALHDEATAQGSARDRYPACKLHLLTVLHHLRQAFGVRAVDPQQAMREEARRACLRRVFKLLAEQFTEPLTVVAAAKVAGMSSTVFREFFKHTTGHTFVDYVREMRLARAAQLLRDTEASVAEVAAVAGFCDQSYLHRCFTRRYQCAPLSYRQMHRQETSGRLSKKCVEESKPAAG